MDEPFYACSMCSYTTRELDVYTAHVIRLHKDDPRFNVSCKSCLRSFTKWDSYRKHMQRSCTVRSVASCIPAPSAPLSLPTSDCEEEPEHGVLIESSVSHEWHEASFILNIKCVVSQVAIDRMLTFTKDLVSDILSQMAKDIADIVPDTAMKVIENRLDQINKSLFKRLSSAHLQKTFFKKHFNLVVS